MASPLLMFPVLEHEGSIQVGDKTRIRADKTFKSGAAAAFSAINITPDQTNEVAVYSSTQEDWYLDWVYTSWSADVTASYNDKIDFSQSTDLVATVTPGVYASKALYATAIQTALNAAGGSGTFTVTVDEFDELTISNSTTNFILKPNGDNRQTSLLPHIGFPEETSGASSVTGEPIEYGFKKILLESENSDGSNTKVSHIKLYSVEGDKLFSRDEDLMTWEPDIMKYVPAGRSTYLNIHREAQNQILYYLDKEGYTDIYQKKFTKFALVMIDEVREWSTFLALSIIMWGLSNKVDDVFLKRHYEYLKKAQEARSRAILRIDIDGDKVVDLGEDVDLMYGSIFRR
jgi:hypothetical protein